MVEEKNESIGGYGYGGGYGGDGIVGLIALLSIFRGNLFGGNYGEANAGLAQLQAQLGDIRADLGDVKYDAVSNLLNQTMNLMGQITAGRMENLQALFTQTTALQGELNALNVQVLNGKYETGQAIANSQFETYKGQMALSQQLAANAAAAAQCCCETNLNMERGFSATNLRMTELDYQGQLRDQANFATLLNGQTEIKCLIKDTAKDQELAALRTANERSFISNEINKSINTTVGSWAAARAFNGPTYPNPPYNGAWGF